MKILIVGDSFSDPTWTTNTYHSWPELLARDYSITNLSRHGSSTWWSYQQFKKYHSEYDFCIFTITVPTRIYLENTNEHLNINSNTLYKGILLEEIYYERFYSRDRENFLQKSIVDDILNTKNTLAIPAFAESIPSYLGWTLCHISDKEADFYKMFRPLKFDNHRHCHLSREGNQTVYNKVTKAITNKDNILVLSEDDYVQPAAPKEYYWP